MGTFNPPASFTAPPDQVDPVLRQVKKIMVSLLSNAGPLC
jgi:hypothetical protein